MSDSKQTSSNINGLGTDPLQRLASFKPPRDLSLGGVKPSKKVFTPNLIVTRNKNKSLPTANSREQKNDQGRRDRKNNKNKNFKHGPNVIKSSGIFSEGLGATERHSTRISYGRDVDNTHTLQKPTIRVKDVIKIDKELEDQKIKLVFGESGNDDLEESKYDDEIDAPIKLPMGSLSLSCHHTAMEKVKEEVIVKQEPDDEVDFTSPTVDVKSIPEVKQEVKQEVFEDNDVVNLLKSDKPTLLLLQLPDTLPGRGGSVDDDRPSRKYAASQPSTSTTEGAEEKPVDKRCRLADLQEGQIGKLVVRRSGRVTLLLGDTAFEVCSGTKASFYQEVVSVATDDSSRTANMIALGPLEHKLNVIPDWETLLQDLPV